MEMELVWHNFHEKLKGFILRRINHRQEADDILQTVYLKIITQLPKLRDEQKLQAWIYQIARNTVIDYYRKDKRMSELSENIPIPQDTEDNLNEELARCIGCFIRQLPDKYRQAIELTEYHGYSQIQLSEHLGISFSGAKSRVQRGRLKLKELITDCCRLELDRFGNILDYESKKQAETSNSCSNCKGNK